MTEESQTGDHRFELPYFQGLGIGIAVGAAITTLGEAGIYLAAFGATVLIVTSYLGEKLLTEQRNV